MFNENFKYCFSLDLLKVFATDILTIETENSFMYNKQITFTEEDKLFYEAKILFYNYNKPCIKRKRSL